MKLNPIETLRMSSAKTRNDDAHSKPCGKSNFKSCRSYRLAGWYFFKVLILCAVLASVFSQTVRGVGAWTPLVRNAPASVELMILLSDGTVMAANQSGGIGRAWYKLTPDSHGSYVNGTWSTLASMADTRLYYSSQVLTNGSVLVAGGEYGTGGNAAEVYDPLNNTWTPTGPPPTGQKSFYDSNSEILPDGRVIITPVFPATSGGTVIYNPVSNTWTNGPRLFRGSYQDEASWVKLPDDSILTIDPFGKHSERYIPAQNRWVNDSDVPVDMYDPFGGELGAGFLLPNGKAFFLGGTGHTAIYTPSGNATPGTWISGPDIPNGLSTCDAAAAMMVNGKILCAVAPPIYADTSGNNVFPSPTTFYEYDSVSNSFTSVNGPTGPSINMPSYLTMMLDLPDGTVLYSQFARRLYVYTPDGTPVAAGKPTISSLAVNPDKSYHLTGTLLNGITEGAVYGDDAQMNSNYPLVRLTNSAGNVYYARTYNWNSTSVMTGNKPVSTDFLLPTNLPPGFYSLAVIANGNSSDPIPFSTDPLTIVQQPQSQVVLQGTPINFSVSVLGIDPISYQWRKAGIDIPGATTNVYTIPAAQVTDSGSYSVYVNNAASAITSSVAVLTVVPTVPIGFALNNTDFDWSANLAAPWYGQTNISHDSVASAQTWFVTNGGQAILSATTNGPGTLSFYWKVSSQTNADVLTFSTNETAMASISGEVDWQLTTVYLPSGTFNLQWIYAKDSTNSAGQDKAWVDEVSYSVGGTAPFILTQPASQISVGGAPVTFTATANGTPVLAYQWLNDGIPVPGATTTSLPLLNPVKADSGGYSLRVTNDYGAITSSVAILAVVPLALGGDNALDQLAVTGNATNVTAIAAGAWHNLALRDDGTVVSWGNNGSGQGNIPANLGRVAGIAAGGYHSLALKLNRTVAGWGDNFYGQAVPPSGLSNVIALACGFWHNLALRTDGSVVAWGDDASGQTDIPEGLGDIVAVAAGGNHSLALRSDGTVVAWGENTDSQGSYSGQSIVPSDLSGVVAIAAGEYHSLALKSDGTIVAWGDNSAGQLYPTETPTNIVSVAGGGSHSLALRADGTVAAWGNNLSGQCNIPSSRSNVLAIAAGDSHTLLLLGSAPPVPEPVYPAYVGNQFSLLVRTVAGKHYALEYKDTLAAGSWTTLAGIFGNGASQFLIDPDAPGPRRFYRVKQW